MMNFQFLLTFSYLVPSSGNENNKKLRNHNSSKLQKDTFLQRRQVSKFSKIPLLQRSRMCTIRVVDPQDFRVTVTESSLGSMQRTKLAILYEQFIGSEQLVSPLFDANCTKEYTQQTTNKVRLNRL